MALKFLNKKGWHTGSLRNIENVWKAEQKHNAEQSKLEELRKQIQEEREKSEFRQLQEQAGLVPRQERLDFLYESGLAVGKGSSDGFKALEAPMATGAAATSAVGSDEAGSSKAVVPGALFEDKPQTANDAWRKLHSDPLLLIRQREQEALARIKNNPIQMAMIRKSAEAEKKNKKDKGKREKKKHKNKHHYKLKNGENPDSDNAGESEDDRRRDRPTSEKQKHSERKQSPEDSAEGERLKHSKRKQPSKEYSSDDEEKRRSNRVASHRHSQSRHEKSSSRIRPHSKYMSDCEEDRRRNGRSESEHRSHHSHYSSTRHSSKNPERDEDRRKHAPLTSDRYRHPISEPRSENIENMETQTEPRSKNITNKQPQTQQGPGYNRRKGVPKMTEEEREARLREMQENAELHEEQRWKRIKKADEKDAQDLARAKMSSGGKNFLDDAQKSIFGTEKGGSTTIEESVRRRAYYSQGGTKADDTNAFRR